MATVVWEGGTLPIAQVITWTFAGTWEATDIVDVTIGDKVVSITAGSTTTATVVSTVSAALNALAGTNYAEYQEITWSAATTVLTGTADTAGKPFTVTISTRDAGGAADAQTIEGGTSSTGTTVTACTGPNFLNVAGNWQGAALPVDGDTVIFADSSVDVLYGLDLNGVTPAAIYIESSYTGKIGLAPYTTAGQAEYRARSMQFCNTADATNTTIVIGAGDGEGSGQIYLNTGTGQVTMHVHKTGRPQGVLRPALIWIGTHASNVVNVNRGQVGIAYEAGTVATVATLKTGYVFSQDTDAQVWCGLGATLTTLQVSGGVTNTRTAFTTATVNGGTIDHAAGAVTTLTVDGGRVNYRSSGTITTLTLSNEGELDCSQDQQTRTITNINLYKGFRLKDPNGTITATNGYDFVRCQPSDGLFDVVENRTWTPTAI